MSRTAHCLVLFALVGGGCGTVKETVDAAPETVTIAISKVGPGTVTSSPPGIACGSTCSGSFEVGTTVTLMAVGDPGQAFTGWTVGPCTGVDPCTFEVTDPTTFTATFGPCTGTQTFSHTGAVQMFVVPTCANAVTIDAYGAQGGAGTALGGKGGRAQGALSVTPGETLGIYVGGMGTTAPTVGSTAGYPGGFNGGGAVHEYVGWTTQGEGIAGTGGGASDVRRGGSALTNRVIVAGGGGGGEDAVGGDGGGAMGSAGTGANAGGGGTQTAGGAAVPLLPNYPNEPGALGVGGNAFRDGGGTGAGGGGYYGGGAGQFSAGGGGSSFIDMVTAGVTTAGVREGHGEITISW